jgi:nucleotide-binding universal stress UspA family protein
MIVGVDGTDGGDRALVTAAELAAAAGCGLVVHVSHVPTPVTISGAGAAAFAATADEVADTCHMACEVTLAGTGVPWSFEIRRGHPATELLRAAADHDAAAIIVGRHGHHRLARLVLGSVTDRLVHDADRPVLVVPPAPPP